MNKAIFLRIQEQLALVPEIVHIDRWNDQVERLRAAEPDSHPFDLPAVFIEFMAINEFKSSSKTAKRGPCGITIHVLQNVMTDSHRGSPEQDATLEQLSLPLDVDSVLDGMSLGKDESALQASGMVWDADYDNLQHTMLNYSFDVIIRRIARAGREQVEVEAGLKTTAAPVRELSTAFRSQVS